MVVVTLTTNILVGGGGGAYRRGRSITVYTNRGGVHGSCPWAWHIAAFVVRYQGVDMVTLLGGNAHSVSTCQRYQYSSSEVTRG